MIGNGLLPPTPSFLFGRHTNASESDAISICHVLNIVPPPNCMIFFFLLPSPLNSISQALKWWIQVREGLLEEGNSKWEDLWACISLPGGERTQIYSLIIQFNIINENVSAFRNFEARLLSSRGRGEKSQKVMLVIRCLEEWTILARAQNTEQGCMQMGKWKTVFTDYREHAGRQVIENKAGIMLWSPKFQIEKFSLSLFFF